MTATVDDRPSWSKSQVASLRECGRKFLFSHVDSQTGNLTDVPLYKKMKNRHLWAGGVAHDAVGDILKRVRQGEPLPSDEELLEKTKQTMRDDFKKSRDSQTLENRLFEHAYNIQVDADAWKRHWNNVEANIRGFLNSKWLERLKKLGPEAWKAVDDILYFDVDGIKAYVKIDCAVETGGKFFLIDWKTSVPKADDEPALQTAALYAHETWGADPENIDAIAVSLADGKSLRAHVSEDSMMETFMRIQEESAALQETLEGFSGNPLDAPLPENQQICRWCNYKQICHPAVAV